MQIVIHPAFRLGFLDACSRKPFDHDLILDRIRTETPETALRRIGFGGDDLFGAYGNVALAQYRYEEGRLLVIRERLSCKSWNHPDFPPAQVRRYIERRACSGKIAEKDGE